MEKRIQMKPYGWLRAQGEKYYLLNPQPISKDSCWQDGTYMFFAATLTAGVHVATTIITNDFSIEYDTAIPYIEVLQVTEQEEPVENEDWISIDDILEQEAPVMDDDWEPLMEWVPDDIEDSL